MQLNRQSECLLPLVAQRHGEVQGSHYVPDLVYIRRKGKQLFELLLDLAEIGPAIERLCRKLGLVRNEMLGGLFDLQFKGWRFGDGWFFLDGMLRSGSCEHQPTVETTPTLPFLLPFGLDLVGGHV